MTADTYAVEPVQPGDDPLTITHKRIYARRRDYREDALVATAHVVQALTDRQAHIVYDLLTGRPLTVGDADLAQFIAQRLGIVPNWWHCDLTPGAEWAPGRKEVEQ